MLVARQQEAAGLVEMQTFKTDWGSVWCSVDEGGPFVCSCGRVRACVLLFYLTSTPQSSSLSSLSASSSSLSFSLSSRFFFLIIDY